MSTVASHRPIDPAIITARKKEDVLVGEEIVRHSLYSRTIHWTVAVTFFAALLTGMAIWTRLFAWLAPLFGGLPACRVIHPWAGIAFFIASIFMFFDWSTDMRFEPHEKKGWWGPRLFHYLRWEVEDTETGKYNGGQKFFFWTVGLGALGVLLSGLIMWFPRSFPQILREFCYLIHDITFILFAVAIVWHIYLGTSAEPGTFRSMTRGTVTPKWARLHHPKWYRQVTGAEKKAPPPHHAPAHQAPAHPHHQPPHGHG
jgi:formate dehydrogenase subunit gamma